MAHTLTYKGVGILPFENANIPTQMWIAARYIESVSLVVAPSFIDREVLPGPVAAIYGTVVLGLLVLILGPGWFPDCYVDGTGPTPFKVISEYLICALILLAIRRTYRHRAQLGGTFSRLMTASLVLTILSELSFTLYTDVFGLSNLVGHYFKIVSFYCLYKGVIENGLANPSDVRAGAGRYRPNRRRKGVICLAIEP